jgi:AcrR family transcriptional regulator
MDETIKDRLRDKAQALFQSRGFKKTTVADIADEAGIAVGSFYKVYPSKEHLFLEIFADVNLRREMEIVASEVEGDDIIDYAKRMIRRLNAIDKHDPILGVWYDRMLWHKITAKCAQANIGQQHTEMAANMFAEIIHRWQQQGKIRTDLDAGFVLALFDVLSVVDLYADDIGQEYFPALIDTMVEFLMQGLMCPH